MSGAALSLRSAVVTGPTGVVGTALVRALAERGVLVYAVTHPGSKRSAALPQSSLVRLVPCGLEELSALPEKIAGPADAFFHLAWAGTQNNENRFAMHLQNDNVRFALDSVQAAAVLGCQVYVGAGSQAEYGRVSQPLTPATPCFPVSGYGMAKLCAGGMTRLACKEAGLRHIWPRILSVYGPSDAPKSLISYLIRSLRAGETPQLSPCEQMWDYLASADAARALVAMAEKGRDGSVYVLGSGQPRSLAAYVRALRDILAPGAPLAFGAHGYHPDQAMYLAADIRTLAQDTGWRPELSFEEGLLCLLASEERPL